MVDSRPRWRRRCAQVGARWATVCAFALLRLALVWGCGSQALQERKSEGEAAVAPVTAAVVAKPLVVEHAGCDGGERGRATCLLAGATELGLWVEGAAPQVSIDAHAVEPRMSAEVDGGTRLVVAVPAGAKVLRLDREGSEPWTLQLVATPPTPLLDDIRRGLPEQDSAARTPRLEAALQRIDADLAKMSGYEKVETLRLATVLAWDAGKDASGYGRAALDAALAFDDAGKLVDIADVFIHMVDEGSTDATWALELATLYAANVADAGLLTRWRMDLADQALFVGDASGGIEHLRAVESTARRHGLRGGQTSAVARLAAVLGSHARETERIAATERFLALLAESGDETACNDAAKLVNVASASVYARLSGGTTGDPEPMLALAVAAFEADGARCATGDNPVAIAAHELVRANLVLSSIIEERWDEAQARLRWFDGREVIGPARGSVEVSRIEVAMHRGDLKEARTHIVDVSREAELLRWRHAMVVGRLEERAGRPRAALASYLDAERVLDTMAWTVAVPDATAAHLGLWGGAARAIRLYGASGEVGQAAAVARASRARALRPAGRAAKVASLTAAERVEWAAAIAEYERLRADIATTLASGWTLPADERRVAFRGVEARRAELRIAHQRAFEVLAGARGNTPLVLPAAGELWLVFHPGESGTWVLALEADDTRMLEMRGDPASSGAELEAVLASLDESIARATSIRVLATGATHRLPIHLARWRGRALIEHVPVAWSADAGRGVARDAGHVALIVSDPATLEPALGRLPLAAREAAGVEAKLSSTGLQIVRLHGDDAEATRVLDALSDADWFHYAGHGRNDAADAWEASLPLASESRLTVRDIVTVARAPRVVVLSGCETAEQRGGGGINLATAFVLAGTQRVIGTTTEIADEDALDMSASVYAGVGTGDIDAGFRAAVIDGHRRGRAWASSIRLLVP